MKISFSSIMLAIKNLYIRNKNYEFTINPEISLTEQNISKEASAIIVTIFRDYFATEEQKGKLEKCRKSPIKIDNWNTPCPDSCSENCSTIRTPK